MLFLTRACFLVDICEGTEDVITCSGMDKSLEIVSAFYGRRDNDTCPHATVGENFNETCGTDDVLERLKRTCDGRQLCNLGIYGQFGDDPCPNVYKYLNIEYRCKGGQLQYKIHSILMIKAESFSFKDLNNFTSLIQNNFGLGCSLSYLVIISDSDLLFAKSAIK